MIPAPETERESGSQIPRRALLAQWFSSAVLDKYCFAGRKPTQTGPNRSASKSSIKTNNPVSTRRKHMFGNPCAPASL